MPQARQIALRLTDIHNYGDQKVNTAINGPFLTLNSKKNEMVACIVTHNKCCAQLTGYYL